MAGHIWAAERMYIMFALNNVYILTQSRDDVVNRSLPWFQDLLDNNTAANCLGLCHEFGYMSGAMEWSQECCKLLILPQT